MRIKKWFTLSTIMGVLALSACSEQSASGEYVGYVEGQWVYVSAPQPGWVRATTQKVGDRVEVGDVLVQLDDDREQAALAQASALAKQAAAQAEDLKSGARPAEIRALEAQLEQAQANLNRAKDERDRVLPLVANGGIAVNRAEQAEAEYQVAKAAVAAAQEAINVAAQAGREARQRAAVAAMDAASANQAQSEWRLQQRTVSALHAGRVEEIFHYVGEYVSAGAPLLAILPDDALKVRFFVPQDELPEIIKGATVNVYADGIDAPLQATVSYIAQQAQFTPPVIYSSGSRDRLVFLVEADLPSGSALNPGLPVDVRL